VREGADAKKVANWVQNEVARLRWETADGGRLQPRQLAQLIRLVDDGTVSSSAARQVLATVYQTGKDPRSVVDELGLAQVSDVSALEEAARAAIEANPAAAADYRAGKTTAMNFLKGQVMKATRGKANPAVAEELLRKLLG
jgi:aspartyl-tRNA(Asn)/glutamyl-tRNA(Gln) amidotransferase subunit B